MTIVDPASSVKDAVIIIPEAASNTVKTVSKASIPEFLCPRNKCTFKTHSDLIFTRHLESHKKSGKFLFTCISCKSKFVTSPALGRHQLRQCAGIGRAGPKTRKAGNNLLPSIVRQRPWQSGPFQCTKCDYKCGNWSMLISHMKIHFDERPFPCNVPGCSFRTKRLRGILTHARLVHKGWVGSRTRTCPTKSSPAVKQAMTAASSQQPKPPLQLPDVKGYQYHEKVPCPHCSKQVFARCLHTHILSHTKPKPYSCSYCSYRSKWRRNVKMHEQKRCNHRSKATKKVQKEAGNVAVQPVNPPQQDQGVTSGHFNPAPESQHGTAEDPPIPAESSLAIPPDSTFACMLCTFFGTSLESAIAHAATHTTAQLLPVRKNV